MTLSACWRCCVAERLRETLIINVDGSMPPAFFREPSLHGDSRHDGSHLPRPDVAFVARRRARRNAARWKVVEFKEVRFSVSLPEGYTQKKQKVTRAGEALE